MSTAIVTDEVYPIKQGERITITNDRTTLTLQVKYADATNWIPFASGGDNIYTLPFMKDGEFKATVQTGGTEARFDATPHI